MDSAFKTKPYPGYTTAQLEKVIADRMGNDVMIAEVARRKAVEAGDYSDSTDGERLRNPEAYQLWKKGQDNV